MKKQKAKRKTRSRSPAGLYLWAVQTSDRSKDNHLWITTSRNSMDDAVKKAIVFLDRNGRSDVRLSGVTEEGTIDA